jgi:hypothetical protein
MVQWTFIYNRGACSITGILRVLYGTFYGSERLRDIWYTSQFGSLMRKATRFIRTCIQAIGGGKHRYASISVVSQKLAKGSIYPLDDPPSWFNAYSTPADIGSNMPH